LPLPGGEQRQTQAAKQLKSCTTSLRRGAACQSSTRELASQVAPLASCNRISYPASIRVIRGQPLRRGPVCVLSDALRTETQCGKTTWPLRSV
jgi:hypothetical protein